MLNGVSRLGVRVVGPPVQVTRRSVRRSRRNGVRSGRLATLAPAAFAPLRGEPVEP